MENQDQNSLVPYGDSISRPTPDTGVIRDTPLEVNSLSAEPEALVPFIPQEQRKSVMTRFFKIARRMDVILTLMLLAGAVVAFVALTRQQEQNNSISSSEATRFGTVQIPLDEIIAGKDLGLSGVSNVTINGMMQLNNGLRVIPSLQPTGARAGQIYYDQGTNQLAYFNGEVFVFLTSASVTAGDLQSLSRVESLNGATGQITLGDGLSLSGNQLNSTGVLSVQGQDGDVTLTAGPGIVINGTNFSNSGIISITAGSPDITVTNDGNGNVTIDVAALPGSGTVASSGGTPGAVPLFTDAQNIEDSIITQSGLAITVSGDLTVTGQLNLGIALTVGSGGTGVTSLPANSVVISNGTAPFSAVTSGGSGLCLVSTAGAPTFAACPEGGVASLNGLSGILTLANATGSVNTITIDDAGTSSKGIASFSGANFTVAGGAVNTVQNIGTGASPTFVGVNTNTITPSGALTVGSAAQSFALQGNASSQLIISGGGQTTTVGFSGTPSGSVVYNFDRSAPAGVYEICTSAANCAGPAGGVTTAGGTTDRLSKFTGAQAIGDSSVSDDGSTVTVVGTANLIVQGGTSTLGTLTQAGNLILSDGSSNTATVVISGHAINRTYTIPDAGADATFCLSTGNCIGGGGGGAPNDATYLVASLNGSLSNERALAAGSNLSLTDGGANGALTVATVQNPTFTTSVTTPMLQSSGALTISSAAGEVVAITAGTTIELQSNTNVSGTVTATGITSAGTITFTGLNCTSNANGGALTANASGQLICTDDDGGAGGISGSGTAGAIPVFTGTQTVSNSIITQVGTTITIAGDLVLNDALTVANGGTGATSFTANGLLYGNGSGALQVTTAGTGGQVLIANALGVPTFVNFSNDISVSSTGTVTIQNDAVALGADTTGDFVANLGTLTGLTTTGNTGEGSTPTLSVTYGSGANTAVQGNTTLTCAAGTGNLGGGGNSITLGGGGACNDINIVNNPTFSTSVTTPVLILSGAGSSGSLQVASLGQPTTYTLPDPGVAAATICLNTGNCAGAGDGVTTVGGTTNRLSKFTGTQAIGDSSVSDDGSVVTINGSTSFVVQGGAATLGTLSQSGTLVLNDGSLHTVSIITANLSADRTYTLPDVGGDATLCVNSGNCLGGSGGAPNVAEYLVANLDATLSNERALTAGSNISLTDGGANSTFTVATVQNPTFTTSVTTPLLQSGGVLAITSAAGTVISLNAGTTIELQDSTNITGALDVSAGLNAGTLDAFQINTSGAIAAATGITSSGTIVFSGLNCTTAANGGALTTNALGQLICSDDDGGVGGAISGSGTSGTLPIFNGAQSITDSIVTQSGTTIQIAGDLSLGTTLTVGNGGTGATSFTTNGLLYGNGAGAVQVTSAGTSGQVLIANATGVPTFVSFSGDINISDTGLTAIQPNSVALGADTVGDYVANLGTLTGLTATGNSGEASTPTLSVTYGSTANTAVQGNVTVTCPTGTGNLSGGGNSITIGLGGSCNNISIASNPTFSTSVTTPSLVLTGAGSNGSLQVASLGQATTYTLPDPGVASVGICLTSGNCAAAGAAGGDLTGSYPNPTIASLQGTVLTIAGVSAGHVLLYNGTNGQWENHAISGDVAISEVGATTIQANAVALGTDTTGDYAIGVTAGNGISVSGTTGEGWSPNVSVLYGSSANTAVQGNTSISITAGTNLAGGGSITLGAGGSVTLNVASSPIFSGNVTVQGGSATVGTTTQQGSMILHDGSTNTGTLQTAALGQNTTYILPDPGAASATICLTTGNCAGSGSGVTTTGGTTNRLSKFTGAQAIGDSSVSDDGAVVTINGSANLIIQGGTGTFGTTSQAGAVVISDGSSNTISVVSAGLAANRIYTLPDAGADATFCLSTGNCIGGGGGGAPNDATYLVTSLNGTLTNERALAAGSNIAFTDAGANGNFSVATVQNPTFTTSVTTPLLQSGAGLTIASSALDAVVINAGTSIELEDNTNITGNLDVSAALNAGTSNAFQINSAGAIAAATGITSSGTITFSALNCTTFANGGALTTNASGQLACSDDDGGAGGAVTGSGTTGTLPVFSGAQTIADSIITQSATTINIAGDLTLTSDLTVANGGTGASSFTANGLLYGNGTGALQVTAAGTSGQILIANATGVPTFTSLSGDLTVSGTGLTAVQANAVALGTDTTGDFVANLGTLTGLSTAGNSGEGSTPSLSVLYGSGANTAVQGNTTLTCAAGTGNLSGGGNSITLGTGGVCGDIAIVNNPTFSTSVTTPTVVLTGAGSSGSLQVATLGQATTYTLPDPGVATASFCLTTGNCTALGSAGGDLTGSYPNPTIASLQGSTLSISAVASGNILQYNGTAWVNHNLSGDITLNSSGVATIANDAVGSAEIADNSIVNSDLATGSFGNITGVGTLTGLTVVGATNINTTGTANTAIGNATGTFQVASAGLNVSAGGALTGVTGITTSGGYLQTGVSANTFSGATSLTAAGTALSVTNDATIGGALTVNTITPNSALTIGATTQSFELQGNATSTITATNGTFTTTLGFATPTANTTINIPALSAGTYTVCTSAGNCGGIGATLQTAYTNSTNPEITVDATRGALTVRDAVIAIGANLLEVQSNDGSTTYFNVTASGSNTTGTNTTSGNINTTGGSLQTNTTNRIDVAGNLVNIGNLTATGAITIASTGGGNDIIIDGADQFIVQDSAVFNGSVSLGSDATDTLTVSSILQGQDALVFEGGTADANELTFRVAALSADRVITLPDETGTLCLQGSASCGFASSLQAAYNLSTSPELIVNTTNGAVTIRRDAGGAVTTLFEVQSSGGADYFNVNTNGVVVNGTVDAGDTGTVIATTYRSNNQTAASTSSAATTFTSGQVSGLTSNSGAVTLQSGHSLNTGNSGDILITSGNATAGNSGTVTIDVGTASGTAGEIIVGSTNTDTVNIGMSASSVNFGTGGSNLNAIVLQVTNDVHTGIFLQNPTVDATHIQYALSKRDNNLNLSHYAYDGTTFWSYFRTDWTDKRLTFGSTATFQNVSDSSTAFRVLTVGNIPMFNIDTLLSRVYIGSTTPDANGALLVLDHHGSDPTGVNGGMYYSSSTNKFRCYEGGAWRDCLSSGPQTVTFTSSGTFSKASYPWATRVKVRLVGGGGGGGGAEATAAGQASMGGGGGGGAYAEGIFSISSLASGVTVTIGAGGTGVSGGTGNNGGTTSFGSLVVAGGGTGSGARSAGSVANGVSGGEGGTATAGDILVRGDSGAMGWGDSQLGISGNGGASALGGGGPGRRNGTGGNRQLGLAGLEYGGGGGGALNSGGVTAAAGGDGAPGIVIIELY